MIFSSVIIIIVAAASVHTLLELQETIMGSLLSAVMHVALGTASGIILFFLDKLFLLRGGQREVRIDRTS